MSVPPKEDAWPVSTRKRSRAVQFRSVGLAVLDIWHEPCPCVLGYISPIEWNPCDAKSATICLILRNKAGPREKDDTVFPQRRCLWLIFGSVNDVLVGAIGIVSVDGLCTVGALAEPLHTFIDTYSNHCTSVSQCQTNWRVWKWVVIDEGAPSATSITRELPRRNSSCVVTYA